MIVKSYIVRWLTIGDERNCCVLELPYLPRARRCRSVWGQDMNASVLPVLSVLALGMLSGALAIEGLVLVPYWRSLMIESFAELHAGFGPRLYRFFAPLTAGAVTLAVASAFWAAVANAGVVGRGLTIAAGVLAASLLAFYFLYFHAANQRLPLLAAAGDGTALTNELRRWDQVHRARTVICLAAFAFSVIGLSW